MLAVDIVMYLGLPTWAVGEMTIFYSSLYLQILAVCLAHRKHYKKNKNKKIAITLTIICMFWLAKVSHSGLSLTFAGPGAKKKPHRSPYIECLNI